jgi:hypothetical protein
MHSKKSPLQSIKFIDASLKIVGPPSKIPTPSKKLSPSAVPPDILPAPRYSWHFVYVLVFKRARMNRKYHSSLALPLP